MKTPLLPNIKAGQAFVFMREEHKWDCCEVSVLSIKGDRYTVARCCHVAEGLLAKPGSKRRKLHTWTCTHKELW